MTTSAPSSTTTAAENWMKGFRETEPGFDYPWVNFQVMFDMLAAATNKAGSTDALKVALALEDMQAKDIYGEMNTMRKADHQLLSPFYTAFFTKPVKSDSKKPVGAGRPKARRPAEGSNIPLQLQDEAAAGA